MLSTPPNIEVFQNWNTTIDSYPGQNNVFRPWTETNNSAKCHYQFAILKFNELIVTINSFRYLKSNWDTYNGIEIKEEVIKKSILFLSQLKTEIPDVFPTGRGSIQFEFEKSNGNYLEFEIFPEKINYLLKAQVFKEGEISNQEQIESLINIYNDSK
jgi:hypothetical protein